MSTVLFFSIPATGHVHPSLPLVRELTSRGERVIYYNSEAYRAKVQQTGAEFRAYHLNYDFGPPPGPLAPFAAMSLILGAGESVLRDQLEAARAENPSAIIYDSMCPWGKQIAQLLRRPAICSCAVLYTGSQNLRAWSGDNSLSRHMLADPFTVVRGILRYQHMAFRLRRQFGVTSPNVFDFFANPGDLTLLYTSRYFQIGGDLFDTRFKFVGPLFEQRNDAPPFPLDWIGDAPLLFVSLGTLFNNRPDFFRTCVAAFARSRFRVVIAFGDRVAREQLGTLPENIAAYPYVRQLDLFPRASLFITHGGMNSTSEAAWFGVPMLLAPQVGDQIFIARQVVRLGAGEQIDSFNISPDALREAAERVVNNPAYRLASQKIGESFRAAGGVKSAADEIQKFIRNN